MPAHHYVSGTFTTTITSIPPIRMVLFRESVWKGIISRKRLERNSFAKAVEKELFRESVWNSYFRYKCEKVILSSCGRLRLSEARVFQFFHTTCAKLDLAHAVLFERAQSDILRTECEKGIW